jgi:hypothetical protein
LGLKTLERSPYDNLNEILITTAGSITLTAIAIIHIMPAFRIATFPNEGLSGMMPTATKVAQNISEGHGSTFDGSTQLIDNSLWLWICI